LIILHFLPDAPEPASPAVTTPATRPTHQPANSGQRVKIKLTTCGTSKFNDTNLTCMRRYEVNGALVTTIEENDPTVGFRAVVRIRLPTFTRIVSVSLIHQLYMNAKVLDDGIETVAMEGYEGFKALKFTFFASAPPILGQVYRYSHGYVSLISLSLSLSLSRGRSHPRCVVLVRPSDMEEQYHKQAGMCEARIGPNAWCSKRSLS